MSIKEKNSKLLKTEMAVGLFFLIALLILGYFTIILSPKALFQEKHDYVVSFTENSGNLKDGANVRVKGVIVGRVAKVDMSDDYKEVLVTLRLKKGAKFYKNYKVQVEQESLLGGEFVNLDIGTEQSGELSAGTKLVGQPPINLMGEAADVVHEIRSSLKEDKLMEKVAKILTNLETSSEDIKLITKEVRSGKGTLGRLIYQDDIGGVLKNIEDSLAPLKNAGKSIEVAGKSVEAAGNKVGDAADELKKFGNGLNDIVKDAKAGKGLIGKVLYDEKVWKNIDESVANLKKFSNNLNDKNNTVGQILNDEGRLYKEFEGFLTNVREVAEKLNSGKGTLAKLINDEEAYKELKAVLSDGRKTLQEVQHAVQDFREQAPISTFGGIIFGTL